MDHSNYIIQFTKEQLAEADRMLDVPRNVPRGTSAADRMGFVQVSDLKGNELTVLDDSNRGRVWPKHL